MLATISGFLAYRLRRLLPDPFVFAILLTVATALLAMVTVDATPYEIVQHWYEGFWDLLEFGMQIILMLVSGYAIALSPPVARLIDRVATRIRTPTVVYFVVVLLGGLFSLVSWGWVVITAVLARELAGRVRGVDYPFLTACVYWSGGVWVCGLSSSIPLLLNTADNFLITAGVLPGTIPVTETLGSTLNFTVLCFALAAGPVLMLLLKPAAGEVAEISDLRIDTETAKTHSVAEEARAMALPGRSLSDALNNSAWVVAPVCLAGVAYVAWHFATRGFDLNLNIMAFTFIIVGMICHRTALRYVVAMRRACSNVSGIIFQYPFYAGIMGIIIGTQLVESLGAWLAEVATVRSFPFIAFLLGGVVNFAIPSAGGEWAVLGPPVIETAEVLGAGMPADEFRQYVVRLSLAVAYGETLTNALQPFFFLIILPVMGAGVRLQARDVMGYILIPFACFFVAYAAFVTWVPI